MRSSSANRSPSLNHSTTFIGFPWTVQLNVAVSPESTVWVAGVIVDDMGAKGIYTDMKLKSLFICIDRYTGK